MRRIRQIIATAAILPSLIVQPFPCECGGSPGTTQESLRQYDAVFEGLVTQIELLDKDEKAPSPTARVYGNFLQVTMRVSQAWKGIQTREVHIRTHAQATACGDIFSVGYHYLVFARAKDGTLETSSCSPTAEVRGASQLIQELGPPAVVFYGADT